MLLPADNPVVLKNSYISVQFPAPGKYCYPVSDASLRYSSPEPLQETFVHFWTADLPTGSSPLLHKSQGPMEARPYHNRNVPPVSALQSSSYPDLKSYS